MLCCVVYMFEKCAFCVIVVSFRFISEYNLLRFRLIPSSCIQVIPKDYHEIVLYLEGKRALDQVYRNGSYISD